MDPGSQGSSCHGEGSTRDEEARKLLKGYCSVCGRDADQMVRRKGLLFCSDAHAKAYEEEMGVRRERGGVP